MLLPIGVTPEELWHPIIAVYQKPVGPIRF